MKRYTFKVVVCGDYGVGKTSLLNRFIDSKFAEDYLPTLGVNMLRKEMDFENNKVKLMFWDIAGQELYAHVREQFYEGTQGAMLVYDVTRPESFANITNWQKEIINTVQDPVYFILIGNKIDLELVVPTDAAKKFAEEQSWFFFETSALTGEGTDEAFKFLIRHLLTAHEAI